MHLLIDLSRTVGIEPMKMDHPHIYEIRVEGVLTDRWSGWFEGLTIRQDSGDETLLSGPLVDQSALHGVLMKIRDLGLPLISVHRVKPIDSAGNET